jgi:hypothetical protein
MSLRTQRIILVSLLLLTAALSFAGCFIIFNWYAHAEEGGLFISWDRSGPQRDFLVALTLVISAIASASRQVRIAILGVIFAIGAYLLWALRVKPEWLPDPSRLSQHLTFFHVHFPGSHWWHPVILSLLCLLLIWAVLLAFDKAAAVGGAVALDRAAESRRGRIALAATLGWAVGVAIFFSRYPVTGLAPWPMRPAPSVSFEERLLTKVPAWRWYGTSLLDDFGPYYFLPAEMLIWISRDGRKAAYVGRGPGLSGKRYVVVGKDRGPAFDWIDSITFSPDGSAMGYLAREGKRSFAVVGGRKGPDFDYVHSLTFSQDGRRFAYVGRRSGKDHAVLDGQIGPEFDFNSVSFHPFRCDGKWEYQAQRDSRYFKLVEGEAPVECPKGPCFTFFSADCSLSAELRYLGEKESIVFAGKTIDCEECRFPRFTPDGKLAYIHGPPSHHSLVIDGKAGEGFSGEIEPPVFSRDGNTFAYQVTGYPTSLVVVGTRKGPGFDHISGLAISNDGKTVAYSAAEKRCAFVMVNDRKGPEYDWVTGPLISPDGTKVAYRAWQGYREFIVVNDREGEKFNWVSDPVFSPDGTKLAFAASQGREIWWKVVPIP